VLKRFTAWLLIGLVLAAMPVLAGCGAKTETPVSTPAASEQPAAEQPAAQAPAQASPGKTEDVTELKIEDTKVGTGAEAVAGKSVTVNYTGWLTDGTKFDSSLDSGQPFTFNLGAGEVIPGWDQGVAGMKVGGTRTLTIPPDLGYGPQANGPIPANSTLVFKVELLGVQ
jgi:FKBP-type peptidyl-prolyl cis-trans isomerase